MESLAGALGIAYLAPTAEAGRFQRRPGDGLRGYALVTGAEGGLTLSLWMENGRHLNDRTGQDGFYYEAWLDEVSLGPFNAESGGHGAVVSALDLTGERKAWPTGAPPGVASIAESFGDGLPQGLEVRVTAEPFGGTPTGGIPVLTGQLVWLGRVAAAGAEIEEPDPEIVTADEPSVAAAEEPAESSQGPTALVVPETDIFGLQELPAPLLEEEPPPTLLQEEVLPTLLREEVPPTLLREEVPPTLLEEEPPPSSEEQKAPPPPVAAEELPPRAPRREQHLADYLDQNLVINRRPLIKPASDPHRLATAVQLQSIHPLAPRVYATGAVDGERGGLNLTVRNLPSPAALGKSESTGRPWSAYRAWLIHARTGATMAIGLLNRVWGDQWRLEVPEGLALTRFDTVMICLGERTDPQPKPEPIVLQGSLLE